MGISSPRFASDNLNLTPNNLNQLKLTYPKDNQTNVKRFQRVKTSKKGFNRIRPKPDHLKCWPRGVKKCILQLGSNHSNGMKRAIYPMWDNFYFVFLLSFFLSFQF